MSGRVERPEQACATWQAWLDAVSRAATAVERLADRHGPASAWADGAPDAAADVDTDVVLLPPMPGVVFPASLESRRREVLDRLAAATAAAERRRDELAAELARLASPVTRPAGSYSDGATLDVVG